MIFSIIEGFNKIISRYFVSKYIVYNYIITYNAFLDFLKLYKGIFSTVIVFGIVNWINSFFIIFYNKSREL